MRTTGTARTAGTTIDTPFGDIVRAYRLAHKMTVRETAGTAGISQSYLYAIEKGECMPGLEVAMRLGRLLKIPTLHLGMFFALPPLHGGDGDGDGPPNTHVQFDVGELEDILALCWGHFYRYGSKRASTVVLSVVRRMGSIERNDNQWLTMLSRFHQLLGVLARDMGDTRSALAYGQLAVDLARSVGQPDILAAGLFRHAKHMDMAERTNDALALAREAFSLAPRCRVPLSGYLHLQMAEMEQKSHGPAFAAQAYFDQARALLANNRFDDDGSFTSLTESGIAHQEAMHILESDPRRGLSLINAALRGLPGESLRWKMGMRASECLAYVEAGDIEMGVGLAIDLVPTVQSASHLKTITRTLEAAKAAAPDYQGVHDLSMLLRKN